MSSSPGCNQFLVGTTRNNTELASDIEYFDYRPGDARLSTHPIERPGMFAFYKDADRSNWTVEEIDLSKDRADFKSRLSPGQRKLVSFIVGFFSVSDGVVNVNLAERFKKDVKFLEASYFYNFQMMMEDKHAEMYALLIDAIIVDPEEKRRIQNAATTIPVIAKMTKYIENCSKSNDPLPVRLLKMACVEGIFFAGCFCAIYWLQSLGLMPGLGHSNQLITRDEWLHTIFSLYIYELVKSEYKLSYDEICNLIDEAVAIANEFICEALDVPMVGMNADLMLEYIKTRADDLLALINQPAFYKTSHIFRFMDQMNLTTRANFFERRSADYSKASHQIDDEIATDF